MEVMKIYCKKHGDIIPLRSWDLLVCPMCLTYPGHSYECRKEDKNCKICQVMIFDDIYGDITIKTASKG